MQVNATLIAAQQAAREAQTRFQAQHVPKQAANSAPGFAAALNGTTDAFAPLPLKQTAAAPAPQPKPAADGARMGTRLDIRV